MNLTNKFVITNNDIFSSIHKGRVLHSGDKIVETAQGGCERVYNDGGIQRLMVWWVEKPDTTYELTFPAYPTQQLRDREAIISNTDSVRPHTTDTVTCSKVFSASDTVVPVRIHTPRNFSSFLIKSIEAIKGNKFLIPVRSGYSVYRYPLIGTVFPLTVPHIRTYNYYYHLFIYQRIQLLTFLTHWGRVTHICVSELTTIGSDNGLSPGRRQAIIWTNAGIMLIRT